MVKRWLLVTAIGAGACGSDPVSIDDYADQYVDAVCTQLARCEKVVSVAGCKATLRLDDNLFLTLFDAVKMGTIEYSADAAGECIEQQRDYNCVLDGFHTSTSCDDVFRGTVVQGGACFIAAECANFAACTRTDPSCDPNMTCCPGTCGPPNPIVASGGFCDGGDRCEDGTYCKPAASGTGPGTCSALVETEGAACAGLLACANPFVCNTSADLPTCQRPARSGETCVPDRTVACADSRQYCDSVTMKCVDALPAGAACESSLECSDHAICLDRTCQDDLAEGEACTPNGAFCQDGLDCTDGTCQREAKPPAMSCY